MTSAYTPSRFYPVMEEVEKADKLTLGRWVRDLDVPANNDQEKVLQRICHRFMVLGGFDLKTTSVLFPAGQAGVFKESTFTALVHAAVRARVQ